MSRFVFTICAGLLATTIATTAQSQSNQSQPPRIVTEAIQEVEQQCIAKAGILSKDRAISRFDFDGDRSDEWILNQSALICLDSSGNWIEFPDENQIIFYRSAADNSARQIGTLPAGDSIIVQQPTGWQFYVEVATGCGAHGPICYRPVKWNARTSTMAFDNSWVSINTSDFYDLLETRLLGRWSGPDGKCKTADDFVFAPERTIYFPNGGRTSRQDFCSELLRGEDAQWGLEFGNITISGQHSPAKPKTYIFGTAEIYRIGLKEIETSWRYDITDQNGASIEQKIARSRMTKCP